MFVISFWSFKSFFKFISNVKCNIFCKLMTTLSPISYHILMPKVTKKVIVCRLWTLSGISKQSWHISQTSLVILAGGGQGRAACRHCLCVSGLCTLWPLLPTPAQSCGWFPVWPVRDTLLPAPCPVRCLGSEVRAKLRNLSSCPQSGPGLSLYPCCIYFCLHEQHYLCLGQCLSLCFWLCFHLDIGEPASAVGSPPSASRGAAQQNVPPRKKKVSLWILRRHSGWGWGVLPLSYWADVLCLTATWTKRLNVSSGKQETSETGDGAAWKAGCPCICSLQVRRRCRVAGPGCRSSRKSCCGSHKPGAGQSAAEPQTHTAARRGKRQEGWRQASLLEESLR